MGQQEIIGFTVEKPGTSGKFKTFHLPELKEMDVHIAVTHCGLCYTDIQGMQDYYGITSCPFVPGHEIVGTVTAMGAGVQDLQLDQRVGVGWQGRSCMQCEWCLRGEEHLCSDIDHCATWDPYGGFSSEIVVDSRFAYPIPATLPSDHAAVLMCAGISVFTPLQRFASSGGLQVGVLGIGGLGHLAIQFACAMGNHVTAVSSSPAKKEEALGFGAREFFHIKDSSSLTALRNRFDVLLYTSHAAFDWTPILDCLKTGGKLVMIGFSDVPVQFDPLELVVKQLSITGSLVGSRKDMHSMLDFARTHHIKPAVELMPMSQIQNAVRMLQANQARYRIVLQQDLADTNG